jgi:hypothetical protein
MMEKEEKDQHLRHSTESQAEKIHTPDTNVKHDGNGEASVVVQKPDSTDDTGDTAEGDNQYITGLKLFTLLASLTLITFLMMLDMSIIVTVRTNLPHCLAVSLC